MLGVPGPGQPRGRQAVPTGQRPTRPGQGEARGLEPPRGAATTRRGAACARTRAATAVAARGSAAKQGQSRPGKVRTAWRGLRRASPAVTRARSGNGGAARRAGAAAGGGERRRPCAANEEAGLGAKPSEGREKKLSPRGIELRLTEGGESAATGGEQSSGRRQWRRGIGLGLGLKGNGVGAGS